MTKNQGPSPFHLTDTDLQVLNQSDENYKLLTWDFVKEVIASTDLEKLTRTPSQLRLYQQWSTEVGQQYGSSTNFLIQKRLYWKPLISDDPEEPPRFAYKSSIPFAERSDYRILQNDWPYGLVKDIRHICVWLKNKLPSEENTGKLTEQGFEWTKAFVEKTFEQGLGVQGEDRVVWFRNYTTLQSIRGIDHVHVLLRHVDEAALDRILEKPPYEEQDGTT